MGDIHGTDCVFYLSNDLSPGDNAPTDSVLTDFKLQHSPVINSVEKHVFYMYNVNTRCLDFFFLSRKNHKPVFV